MKWGLEIALHWPHDRLALGWDFIGPDSTCDYRTIKVYMFFATLTLDF